MLSHMVRTNYFLDCQFIFLLSHLVFIIGSYYQVSYECLHQRTFLRHQTFQIKNLMPKTNYFETNIYLFEVLCKVKSMQCCPLRYIFKKLAPLYLFRYYLFVYIIFVIIIYNLSSFSILFVFNYLFQHPILPS